MQWNLRQVMTDRGIFQTSELLPLLAERGVHISREHVYRLVTRAPQRVNLDILAALCDALGCDPRRLDDHRSGSPTPWHRQRRPTAWPTEARGWARSGPIRATVRRPTDQ